MLLWNSANKNSPCARKGNKMIPACILFIFANGYGVATQECREGTIYYTPDEIVHVSGETLTTPPDMILITPSARWVSRWRQPTYFQVHRRYVDNAYYYDEQPIVVQRSPNIIVRPRVQIDIGSPRIAVRSRNRARRGLPRLNPRSNRRYRDRQPRYNFKVRRKAGGILKRQPRKKIRGSRINKRNKRQRRVARR